MAKRAQRTPPRLWNFSLLLLLILAPSVHATERRDLLEVQVELLENDLHGQPVKRCGAEGQLDKRKRNEWCFLYGEVAAERQGDWEGIRSRSRCHEGPCASLVLDGWRGNPYMNIDVSARPAGSISSDAGVEVSISLQKLAGFTCEGRPIYQQSRNMRALITEKKSELFVPLLIADAKENEAFGAREILLRWNARYLFSPVAYGKIHLATDVPRADVLLDGGSVGRTSEAGLIILENVIAGTHEVSVRDFAGREVRKAVRVEKDRTAEVTLNLLGPALSALPSGLLRLDKNPQGQEEFFRKKDRALVVRIPEGSFEMGSSAGDGEPAEHPQHRVYVSEFLIDKTEVTWGQFKIFSRETGSVLPDAPLWGTPDDYPITGVTWEEAKAFCQWVGGRLPTEAEWEKAARGTDSRRYPWGDQWDESRCNTFVGGPHRPLAVGMFPECVSPYGLLDMAGSVFEWCEDWYDERYYESSPVKDPLGPPSGLSRVTRGGDWLHQPKWTRVAYRQQALPTSKNVRQGFRCVQSAPMDSSNGVSKPRLDGTGTVPTPYKPPVAGSDGNRPSLQIDFETMSNPIDARPAHRCAVSGQTEAGQTMSWWSTLGEVRLSGIGEVITFPAVAHCGVGTLEDARDQRDIPAFSLLILELTTSSVTRSGPLMAIETSLSLTVRRFSGVSKDGKPIYASSSEKRILRIEEAVEAILPILVPDATEKETLGVHEVLLRMRARRVLKPPAQAYGAVSLATDTPGAVVLLDGGVVGYTSPQGRLELRHVQPGEREIKVRENSGREARQFVEVLRARTVPMLLQLSKQRQPTPSPGLVPLGDNSKGYQEYQRASDGARMVHVPGGELIMGNLETENQPLPHKVNVSAFLIDKTPVTWGQYEKFCQATNRPLPPEPYWGIHHDHPVSFVTWEESRAYCEWAGGRLPTEAEREKAACGTDGRKYPWGDEEPTPERAVFRHSWGYVATEPAGSHPAGASPYDIRDLAGNVWEWCEDWYDDTYYETSPVQDPKGPRSGRARVVRGGSWDSRPSLMSCSCRNFGWVGYREGDFGFRCAAEVPR
jgi:formylglycine-generating enzyme required for sulfatase activity